MFTYIFINDRWSIASENAKLFIMGGATDYVAHQEAADRKYIPICTIPSPELDKPQTVCVAPTSFQTVSGTSLRFRSL
jgi:hypothetical protein